MVALPVGPDPFGGAWTHLTAPAMPADASASTAPANLSVEPSPSPKRARTSGKDH